MSLPSRALSSPTTGRLGWLLVGCLVSWPSLAGAFGFGLAPTTVEIEIRPGERHRQVIRVGNVHPDKTLSFTVGLADWSLDRQGGLQLEAPGSSAVSGASWLRFSPSNVTLDPGESQEIVVDVQAPLELAGARDYRVALLVSTLLPTKRDAPSQRAQVWNRYMVTSLFYLTVPPARSDAEVTATRLSRSDGKTELEISVENRGSRHARLSGEVRIVRPRGDVVHRQAISGVVLGGHGRDLRVPLATAGSLARGSYAVELDLRSERGELPMSVAELPTLDVQESVPAAIARP